MRLKLSPVAVIATTLIMAAAGVGIADAATGGDFILGKANSESSTASLANSKGTPLSLSAPKNTAPLAVDRSTMVANLNAGSVGGLGAAGLELSGADGFMKVETNTPVTDDVYTKVAGTPKLAAGIYYVTATATINVTIGDTGANCVVEKDNDGLTMLAQGGGSGDHFIQAIESVAVSVPKGGRVQELCIIDGTVSSSVVDDAGLTAIRISASSGTRP